MGPRQLRILPRASRAGDGTVEVAIVSDDLKGRPVHHAQMGVLDALDFAASLTRAARASLETRP